MIAFSDQAILVKQVKRNPAYKKTTPKAIKEGTCR